MLSEISQTEKDKSCRISLMCGNLKKQNKRSEYLWSQRHGVRDGRLDEGDQKAQASLYSINEYRGFNV